MPARIIYGGGVLTERYGGIYTITCAAASLVYIGQTSQPFIRRWDKHISDLRHGKHANDALMRAWGIRGATFIFVPLEVVTCKAALDERERFYIKLIPNCCNERR